MANYYSIRQAIDEAIKNKKSIQIRYRDYSKNITERTITPSGWEGYDKVIAYCHLREDERHFRIQNILGISDTSAELQQPAIPSNQARSPQDSTQPVIVSTSTKKDDNFQEGIPSFNKVNTSDKWKLLLQYYIACLNYEYQQSFSFYENALQPLDLETEKIYSFLSGKSHLLFNFKGRQRKFQKFLDPSSKKNRQLCLGKSFIRFSDQKITPLLFMPVSIKQTNSGSILLRPEELSLSYASLLKLDYSPEDVAEFLASYQDFIDDQPPIQEIEKFIFDALSEDILPSSEMISNDNYISIVPNCTYLDTTG